MDYCAFSGVEHVNHRTGCFGKRRGDQRKTPEYKMRQGTKLSAFSTHHSRCGSESLTVCLHAICREKLGVSQREKHSEMWGIITSIRASAHGVGLSKRRVHHRNDRGRRLHSYENPGQPSWECQWKSSPTKDSWLQVHSWSRRAAVIVYGGVEERSSTLKRGCARRRLPEADGGCGPGS